MTCICHTLNLCVKDAWAKQGDMMQALTRLRSLARAVHNSPLLECELAQVNEQLGVRARRLAMDVVTRYVDSVVFINTRWLCLLNVCSWTSTHLCLLRLLENKAGLHHMVWGGVLSSCCRCNVACCVQRT